MARAPAESVGHEDHGGEEPEGDEQVGTKRGLAPCLKREAGGKLVVGAHQAAARTQVEHHGAKHLDQPHCTHVHAHVPHGAHAVLEVLASFRRLVPAVPLCLAKA